MWNDMCMTLFVFLWLLVLWTIIKDGEWSSIEKSLQDKSREAQYWTVHTDFENRLRSLQDVCTAKIPDAWKEIYQTCLEQSEEVKISYKNFADRASELSEMVRYLEAFIELGNVL